MRTSSKVWMWPCPEVLWWVHEQPLQWKATYSHIPLWSSSWKLKQFYKYIVLSICSTDGSSATGTRPGRGQTLWTLASGCSVQVLLRWSLILWFLLIPFFVSAPWRKPSSACLGRFSSWLQQQRKLSLQDGRHFLWVRHDPFWFWILSIIKYMQMGQADGGV